MFDTAEQILDQLRAGEDGRAEFKEVRLGDRGVLSPDTEALAGELVAFANAAGGGVFLGVADSGAVAGIPRSRRRGRALDRQRRHAQLRAADSTCPAQGPAPRRGRRRPAGASGRGSARALRPPDVGRTLLRARRFHEA